MIDAARVDPSVRGVLVYGPAGVGKSRLADHALASAGRDGWGIGRASATAAAEGSPFAALAHLMPADVFDTRSDPVTLYAQVAESFAARSDHGPFMLMVDDLPRLDVSSATLVGQLLDASAVFLVATVRSDETSRRGRSSTISMKGPWSLRAAKDSATCA